MVNKDIEVVASVEPNNIYTVALITGNSFTTYKASKIILRGPDQIIFETQKGTRVQTNCRYILEADKQTFNAG